MATALVTDAAGNAAGLSLATSRGDAWVAPEWPVDGAYAASARTAGRLVAPAVLSTPADVRAADSLGVAAVVTDDVAMARRALGLADPPPGPDPPAPPGPPAVDLLFGSLASDTYLSPRLRLRWRGRSVSDGRATGFQAAVRARGQRSAADWRTLVSGAANRGATFTAAPGAAYDIRVRALDASGILGAAATRRLVVPFDDSDAALRRSGAWERVPARGGVAGRGARRERGRRGACACASRGGPCG